MKYCEQCNFAKTDEEKRWAHIVCFNKEAKPYYQKSMSQKAHICDKFVQK